MAPSLSISESTRNSRGSRGFVSSRQEDERVEALSALSELSVILDHEMASLSFTLLSDLASEQKLSIYDASYLELALRKRLPLACKDGPCATRRNVAA